MLPPTTTASPTVVLRPAGAADAPAVDRLARLDGRRVPAGPTLVAEVGGALVAAYGVERGERLGDPFAPTAEVLDLLELHARESRRPRRHALRRHRLRRPRAHAA